MPKTPSNKLFLLIKSLSGPEKRYFKLFSKYYSQGRDSKYMLLFESMDAQIVFDDFALREILYQSEILETRKYSELKAYLFELILRALQHYEESKFYDLKISRYLNNIKVLFSRSLYQDALEQVKKAERLARKNEDFSTLIKLIEWEKRIPFVQSDIDFLDKALVKLEEDSVTVRKQLSNLIDFRNLYFRIMQLIRKDPLSRSPEENLELENIINTPILKSSNNFLSYRAELLYHRILGLYFYTKFDYQLFYKHSKKFLTLLEANQAIRGEEISEYISALSNFSLSCGLLQKHDEVELTLPKFLKINAKSQDHRIRIHRQYYSIAFSLYIDKGDFQKGKELLLEHFEKIKAFPDEEFQSTALYHSYFYIYFGVGDYDEALVYLNKLLNLPRTNERQDLLGVAQILNLIIHYEMGNSNLLEYLLRSAYRFLKKRNKLFEFERRVISFIKDSEKISSRVQLRERFLKLKNEFQSLEKLPSEKVIFQYFDFISWLESKIKEMPFAQVVSERHAGG